MYLLSPRSKSKKKGPRVRPIFRFLVYVLTLAIVWRTTIICRASLDYFLSLSLAATDNTDSHGFVFSFRFSMAFFLVLLVSAFVYFLSCVRVCLGCFTICVYNEMFAVSGHYNQFLYISSASGHHAPS